MLKEEDRSTCLEESLSTLLPLDLSLLVLFGDLEEIRCGEPYLSSSFLELEDLALFGDLVPGLAKIGRAGDFGLVAR